MPEHETRSFDLVGVGGAHVDRIGHISGPYHAGASNPGRLVATVGGGAFNALRAARLAGADAVALISARGGDHDGAGVASTIEAACIADLSAVFLDRRTASYTAILDASGEQIAGLADMDIYETVLARQLRRKALREALGAARAVILDANLPVAALQVATERAGGPVHALAISPAKAIRLLAIAAALDTTFMNRREMKALTGMEAPRAGLDALAGLGFRRAVVTHGSGPVLVLDGEQRLAVEAPAAERVVDVTGAGDALAGATVAAMLADSTATLADAVRSGVAAAQITLQFEGPVAPAFDADSFAAIRSRARTCQLDALSEETTP